MSSPEKISQAVALLQRIANEYSPATFANSFGAEDMVITDLIAKNKIGIEIFSLDTGRLPYETYTLMEKSRAHYPGTDFVVYFPDATEVETFDRANGINAFYDSVEMRKACCGIRKMTPLKRALSGKKAWVTGLRREQSPTRTDLTDTEFDQGNQMWKFNPLIDWTEKDVWDYLRSNNVPYNELHDKFYPSIGCAPCTRAVAMGEDVRAGRWWWENPETKECGLHVKK